MEVYGLLASGYGDWPIIKQIAWLLGQVMNGIFNVLSAIGIETLMYVSSFSRSSFIL